VGCFCGFVLPVHVQLRSNWHVGAVQWHACAWDEWDEWDEWGEWDEWDEWDDHFAAQLVDSDDFKMPGHTLA
jgi:hypothetical protein